MFERTLSCRVIVGSSALRSTPPRSSGLITISGVSDSSSASVSLVVDFTILVVLTSLSSFWGDLSRLNKDFINRRFRPFSYAPSGSSSLPVSSFALGSVLLSLSPTRRLFLADTMTTVSASYFSLNSSNERDLLLSSASYARRAAASYGIAKGFSGSEELAICCCFFFSLDKVTLSNIERQIS